jgi:hypothetical protein
MSWKVSHETLNLLLNAMTTPMEKMVKTDPG